MAIKFLSYLKKKKQAMQTEPLEKHLEPILATKQNCYNTTLLEFINAVCDGVWPYTILDWDEVSQQYAELSKDGNLANIFKLRVSITVAENKCKIIEFIVNALMTYDRPELWAILRSPHINLQGKTIEMVKTQAKRYVTQLNDLNDELKQYISDKKTTRADFDEKLVILEKFIGYQIAPEATTIAKYVAICNQYNDYVAIKNTQAENKNGRR